MDFALISRVVKSMTKTEKTKKDSFTDNPPVVISTPSSTSLSDIVLNYLRSHLGNDIQSGSTINTQTSPQSVLSGSSTVLINDIVGFIISCFAAYLAWSCNPTMTFMRRFSHAVLAFLFGMFYLVYSISFITTMCTNSSAVSITAVSAFGNGYY